METAFPVYDPLFPKRQVSPGHLDKAHNRGNEIPENWMEHLKEDPSTLPDTKPSAHANNQNQEEHSLKSDEAAPLSTQEFSSPSKHNLTSSPSTDGNVLPADPSDHIVLGPGGQWGIVHDYGASAHVKHNSESLAPRVPAWSLPTLRQPWEFSEITHHGRKKQKSFHRKKKKADD